MRRTLLIMLTFALFATLGTAAQAQSSHSATLNWTQSTSTGVTANGVYRSTTSGSGYALIYTSLSPMVTYTDSAVVAGTTYYYVVTAFVGSEESAYSSQVTATIPSNPNPPTGITVVAK